MLERHTGYFHDLSFISDAPHELAILHLQHTIHKLTHPQVMRDDDPGLVVFVDQVCKSLHHLKSAVGIE